MRVVGGVRILDLTWGMAGPAGVPLLGEHGADVVKVESHGGDPYRSYPSYRVWNRSRRSVARDLKSPEGRDRFLELVTTGGLLAESLSSGVIARLGLDHELLAERSLQLICWSVPLIHRAAATRIGRAGTHWCRPGRASSTSSRPGVRDRPVAGVRERHWPPFCGAAGRRDLETDPRFADAAARYANRIELGALLGPVFRTQRAIQWRRRLDAAGVPAEISVNTVDGELALFDEENLRLGLVSETRHATAGRLRQVGNSLEIVRWLGHEDAAVADYLQRGIIATDGPS